MAFQKYDEESNNEMKNRPGKYFLSVSYNVSCKKKVRVICVANSSVVKILIIRPKPGQVAKNATPRPFGWESNPRPLDY